MSALRILVADDHEIVREGVRALVERQPDWTLCGEAATGRQAVQRATELKPDVIVMDVSMPELNGLDATRQIKRLLPKTEILIFTADEADDLVRGLFKAGARAYLLKSDATKHLVPAINALRAHRTYFSSRVSELVFSGYLKDDAPASDKSLTSRERETVQLVAEGKTNKEIAAILGISIKTVESHRAGTMKKLGLGSIAELVRYAIHNGLAPP
jgi:DNA-binding NarL/FixJ family response regulator